VAAGLVFFITLLRAVNFVTIIRNPDENERSIVGSADRVRRMGLSRLA
jgi:hypothetical protein